MIRDIIRPVIRNIIRGPTESVGAVAAAFLLHDDFTDTNGTLIAAHTPTITDPGNPWFVAGGVENLVWEINNNRLRMQSRSFNLALALIDLGVPCNFTQAVVRLTAGTWAPDISIRSDATGDNRWIARLGANLLQIFEETATVEVFRAQVSVTTNVTTTDHEISLEADGTDIIASSVTDSVNVSFTSNTKSTNQHCAVYASGNPADAEFDDLRSKG